MSIIPASSLSASDLRSLGNNVEAAVQSDHEHLEAINRSLYVHNERVARLYRRSGHVRVHRVRRHVAA